MNYKLIKPLQYVVIIFLVIGILGFMSFISNGSSSLEGKIVLGISSFCFLGSGIIEIILKKEAGGLFEWQVKQLQVYTINI